MGKQINSRGKASHCNRAKRLAAKKNKEKSGK